MGFFDPETNRLFKDGDFNLFAGTPRRSCCVSLSKNPATCGFTDMPMEDHG